MKYAPEGRSWFEGAGPAGPWTPKKIAALVAGAFLVGYIVAALWMWIGSWGQSVVTVPTLRNLSVEEARRATDAADLTLEVSDSLPHPEIAAGSILTQTPLPGQEVAPGIAVQVIVSSGRARFPVPDVSGFPQEQAVRILAGTGLTPTVEVVEDRRPAGTAIETAPAAGTVVRVPAGVRLRVSSGPPMVVVPNLVGLREEEVAGLLESAGLTLGQVERRLRIFDSAGQVLSQRPAAGSTVEAGSSVDIGVSTQRIRLPRIF